LVHGTLGSSGLHHCLACHTSASRESIADANRDVLINTCASARHANTNTDGQCHTVTATADTNRNTYLHPTYANSHADANVDRQPDTLTTGPNINRNSDPYAAYGNTHPYINSVKHRKRKPNHTDLLRFFSNWYGSTRSIATLPWLPQSARLHHRARR
jgi:hypothetical protein